MRLPAVFRLLLTGTPLQNNLQELASLLAFILPEVFNEKREDLASIFKYKAKTTDNEASNSALLSIQRIKRARAMMTPFVLRRKKQQVCLLPICPFFTPLIMLIIYAGSQTPSREDKPRRILCHEQSPRSHLQKLPRSSSRSNRSTSCRQKGL